MPENLLKISEVAARLSCTRSFVYALVESGRLKHHRLGRGQGGIRVSEEQLQEYLRGTEKGGGPRPQPDPPAKPVRLKHLRLKRS
jgi:excisionase family DNA binding protein